MPGDEAAHPCARTLAPCDPAPELCPRFARSALACPAPDCGEPLYLALDLGALFCRECLLL